MHILLQNPIILLILLVSVIRFIGRRLAASRKTAAGTAPSPAALEESERTRRVREEVARKIAERRGRAEPPVVAARSWTDEPPDRPEPAEDTAAELAEQQRLAEQVRLLDQARALARSSRVEQAPGPVAAPVRAASNDWLRDLLSDPQSARRAIMLREVLGPPVGMR